MRHGLKAQAHARLGQELLVKADTLSARERIMNTAEDLFYRYGIRSVGIDRIIEESNVAKMTFYKHFPSKSNLIAAYLERQENRWHQILAKAVERDACASDRILAIFDVLREECDSEAFQGCPFIKALAEFGRDQTETQIQAYIAAHFMETDSTISRLVKEIGLPQHLTQAIASLIFGALVVAHTSSRADVIDINRKTAQLLLDAHSPHCGQPSVPEVCH
jgi:AcrR family transcriptional regulator